MTERVSLEQLALEHGLTTTARVHKLRTCELQRLTAHLTAPDTLESSESKEEEEEEEEEEVEGKYEELEVVSSTPIPEAVTAAIMFPQTVAMDPSDKDILNSQQHAMQREREEAISLINSLRTKIQRKQHIMLNIPNVSRLQKFVYQKELNFLITLLEQIRDHVKQ